MHSCLNWARIFLNCEYSSSDLKINCCICAFWSTWSAWIQQISTLRKLLERRKNCEILVNFWRNYNSTSRLLSLCNWCTLEPNIIQINCVALWNIWSPFLTPKERTIGEYESAEYISSVHEREGRCPISISGIFCGGAMGRSVQLFHFSAGTIGRTWVSPVSALFALSHSSLSLMCVRVFFFFLI